jgi:hypothetical protein
VGFLHSETKKSGREQGVNSGATATSDMPADNLRRCCDNRGRLDNFDLVGITINGFSRTTN